MAQATLPTPDLAALEVQLQQHLQTQLPEIAPVQVNCYVKRETLLMVVQHRSPALAHPKRIFRLLAQQFAAEQLDQRYRGLMYLKVDGRPQPYAFHTYTTPVPEQDVAAQVRATSPEGRVEREAEDEDEAAEAALRGAAAPLLPAGVASSPPAEALSERPLLAAVAVGATDEPENAYWDDLATDEPEEQSDGWSDRLWPLAIAAGAIFGAAVFFTSLYLVSRPCVFRRCEPLEVAQELANQALETLQAPPSGRAVLQAQEQLDQAIALLETIPRWSGARSEAENLLAAYSSSAEKVAELVEALQTAARAAALAQNPPLPVARWEEAQRLWRGAIAILEDLPVSSEFYSLAQQKVQEYRENLAVVNRRLQQEREAMENFAAAQEAAKIAEVRGGVAQSLDNLRLSLATWQTALHRLRSIPASTTPYAEAQQLLADYQPKLTQAGDRVSRESFAQDAYEQGERLGQLAATAEDLNQWEEAVTHWRNALNYLRQVPNDSFVYIKAQPLVERYSQALSTSQSRLQEKVQVRQARSALTRLCASSDGSICVYTVTETLISVRLTPTYVQRVRQTSQQAQRSNDVEVQADLLDRIFQLEKALESISEDTGIPLEIYTTDNVLVKRHNP